MNKPQPRYFAVFQSTTEPERAWEYTDPTVALHALAMTRRSPATYQGGYLVVVKPKQVRA